ncbi:MAG: HNH endonuclease [Nanoarchaeota archaeon]
MAIRYSQKWKENVSKGIKKYRQEHPLTDEQRKKLSEYAKKGNSTRIYRRYTIEELSYKSFGIIRNILFKERGRKCENCGWAEINVYHKIIPVQVDHIDGDRKNNSRSNLRILCPNCHSLTKKFMFYGGKRK